ncbi:hypothetical protein BH10ACI1_BH10ACI1_18200 [soil metagenome]
MDDRGQNILDMFISTVQFDVVNFNDYRTLPDAAASFVIVRAAIAGLETDSATQVSGAVGRAVEQKATIREAIRRKLKRYSRTARALNIDDAGFRRLFRIPDNDSDQLLLSTAREFTTEARRFVPEFAGRGIPASLADDLDTDINAMEAAISAKAGGRIESVGASAGVDEQIEKGMNAERILDSIMQNVYFDNPVKLAEWRTARHIKAAPKKKDPPTPPTPPTP